MKKILLILISILCINTVQAQNLKGDYLGLKRLFYWIRADNTKDTIVAPSIDSIGQYQLKNIADPTAPLHGANKRYVDSIGFTQPIDSMSFNYFAPVQIGNTLYTLYPDTANQTISLRRGDSETLLQLGDELTTPLVCNNSGVAIPDGVPVYIYSNDGEGCPTIRLASNLVYDESRDIGITTQSIANGGKGRVTRFGVVNKDWSSLDTGKVYLGSVHGTLTNTKPSGGSWIVEIGSLYDNSTEGGLLVDVHLTQRTAEQNENNGFVSSQRDATTLSFNDANRYAQINNSTTDYYYYDDGVKYIKDDADSVQISDETGLHVVYFDSDILKTVANPTSGQVDDLIQNECLVFYVYWNKTTQEAYYIGDERHNLMDVLVHANLHFTRGAQIPNTSIKEGALQLTDIITGGDGDIDASAQFGCNSGLLIDEDLPSFISALVSTTGIPIYYKTGSESSPEWVRVFNSGFSVYNVGSPNGRLYYNENNGGTWQLTEITNNDFVLCHVYATNDINYGLYAIMGEEDYLNAGTAREGAETELIDITTSGFPAEEIVPIASIIFQTSDNYSNGVQARIISTDLGDDYVDWRATSMIGGGGTGSTSTKYDDLTDVTAKSGNDNKFAKVDATGTNMIFSEMTEIDTNVFIVGTVEFDEASTDIQGATLGQVKQTANNTANVIRAEVEAELLNYQLILGKATILDALIAVDTTTYLTPEIVMQLIDIYIPKDSTQAHLNGAIDGVNDTYTTYRDYRPRTIELSLNGQVLERGNQFEEVGTDSIVFAPAHIPQINDYFTLKYEY